MFKVFPHEQKTLEWWHDQYVEGRIEMQPFYQRRSGIWSHWKQAHLIDSVINDFDVPKFYLADFTRYPSSVLNTSLKPYAVIDGKQRFQALFDFLDDKWPLNTSAVFEDRAGAIVAGLKYSELKQRFPDAANKILNFIPAVMDVVTDEEDRLEELFVRLNSGEHTTGAERRNSMPGPMPAIIRELSVHPFFVREVRFTKKRMQELNLIAKLLLIESKGRFVDTKSRNLDDLVNSADRAYRHAQTEDEKAALLGEYLETQSNVFDVLERMSTVFTDKDILLSSQGAIPIYYWMIRNLRPAQIGYVRDFLIELTESVRRNLAIQRTDPEAGDSRLAHYYTMSRTTNDQQSLAGRYELIMALFSEYLARVGGSRH